MPTYNHGAKYKQQNTYDHGVNYQPQEQGQWESALAEYGLTALILGYAFATAAVAMVFPFVVFKLWNWFLVPGLAPITFSATFAAFAICAIVKTFFTASKQTHSLAETEIRGNLTWLSLVIYFVLGYLIHTF